MKALPWWTGAGSVCTLIETAYCMKGWRPLDALVMMLLFVGLQLSDIAHLLRKAP